MQGTRSLMCHFFSIKLESPYKVNIHQSIIKFIENESPHKFPFGDS